MWLCLSKWLNVWPGLPEVVRAGLWLLEDEELKRARLRRLLQEGEDSGLVDSSYEDLIAELDGDRH